MPPTLTKILFSGKSQLSFGWQLAVFVLFLIGLQSVWAVFSNQIILQRNYMITKKDIIVVDPPSWIDNDFIEQVLKSRSLEETSFTICNPELGKKLSLAFEEQPWVKKAESITMEYPPRILVRLIFREPTALVAAPKENYAEYQDGGFPIDTEGILLPIDYFEEDSQRLYDYMWIEGITSVPGGGYGRPWNDPKVHEAAVLAHFLQDDRRDMGLRAIVVTTDAEDIPIGQYELRTIRGTRIIWGTCPLSGSVPTPSRTNSKERFENNKKSIQPNQTQKLSILRKLRLEYGSLDDLPTDRVPIDLSRVK